MLKQAIIMLQEYLKSLGVYAQIHFELEGCFKSSLVKSPVDFSLVNHTLAALDIDGEIVNEYWKNQWEYVSLFNGQSPLKEADNLTRTIAHLPRIFAKNGFHETLIQPVVWSGDQGKLACGSHDIFTTDTRAVHIPNAIQLNVSVINSQGVNIIPYDGFGEYLQQCFLETSKDCSLLYLPEEEAFERFKLKSYYGLAQELCSPYNISGGHQGSIALYKEYGKHNQRMGEEPLLFDLQNNVLLSAHNWHKTARVEHRLGASSKAYNAYVNVLFALANVADAIEAYQQGVDLPSVTKVVSAISLPTSLYSHQSPQPNNQENTIGAIDLFDQSHWFNKRINKVQQLMRHKAITFETLPSNIGDVIKKQILADYQQEIIELPLTFN
ncbi:hypothetical protein KO495_14635 [Colwellia sp. D2M02]|uniref:hypothetical protein n=1 Tax=Colwellia sp. D2M02 TaxID=2841562 RepID=UPI001C0A38F3|nr:hypothetical protein [Colwellia sp. D2M02]MBU2894544.1 hypothetical protein [Colwellia sp. D2M02]